jgi:hypothetical protein
MEKHRVWLIILAVMSLCIRLQTNRIYERQLELDAAERSEYLTVGQGTIFLLNEQTLMEVDGPFQVIKAVPLSANPPAASGLVLQPAIAVSNDDFNVSNWIDAGTDEQFSMDRQNACVLYQGVIIIVNHDSNALQ